MITVVAEPVVARRPTGDHAIVDSAIPKMIRVTVTCDEVGCQMARIRRAEWSLEFSTEEHVMNVMRWQPELTAIEREWMPTDVPLGPWRFHDGETFCPDHWARLFDR